MRHLDDIAEPGSPERALVERLDPSRLPKHVAIIMDGNGRWANARHLPRVEGHRAGIQAVRQTVEMIARLEIEVVTLYAFSTENWKRPRYEVVTLMGLLKHYLRSELDTMLENNLRFVPIGRIEQLDPTVRRELERTVEATARCTGSTIQIALNYSGRQEITDVVRRAVIAARAGEIEPDVIDETWISQHLSTARVPDPDLLIRTSGEQRISNFLLWQLAYSEIYFTPVLWPDFSKIELLNALLDYQRRERRFGGLSDEGRSLFTAPGDLSAGS
jgi:undecaprenyl diphosphate synthase